MNEINELYAEITALKNYLASTDYHILKSAESEYTVPDDVLKRRGDSRARINQIEIEIKEIAETQIQDGEVIADSSLAE